ncbi:MAG: hypothetical protein WBD36_04725 [Bacteroidota bacterium]
MDGQAKTKYTIDWRWVIAAYCYLVLFHLFPTYLMNGFTIRIALLQSSDVFKESTLAAAWLMGGVGVVAFVVGWRSKGVTILEPLVAGMLYGITMAVGYHALVSSFVRERKLLAAIFWLMIIVIVSSACAWIGEAYQRKQEARRQRQLS